MDNRTTGADQYVADREQAEAEASLCAARDLFLKIELLDGLSDSLAITAGELAATLQEHLAAPRVYGYRESEVLVGEARDMIVAARGLVGDLRYRYATRSPVVMAGDAVHELEDHLARLERADLQLRTGAFA